MNGREWLPRSSRSL